MKADKFEILSMLILKEQNCNHYSCYVSIGQLANLIRLTWKIEEVWDDTLTLTQNVNNHWTRSISPLGQAGKNKL